MERWLYIVKKDEAIDLRMRKPDSAGGDKLPFLMLGPLIDGMLSATGQENDAQANAILKAFTIRSTFDERQDWNRAVFALRSVAAGFWGDVQAGKF